MLNFKFARLFFSFLTALTLFWTNASASENIESLAGFTSPELLVVPPPSWSNNRLSFTFDASNQPVGVTGTYKAIVTVPSIPATHYAINGQIGAGAPPIVLQIGPPSLYGNYTLTFQVLTLVGGPLPNLPTYLAQNLTTHVQASGTFNVQNAGDQSSRTFLNN